MPTARPLKLRADDSGSIGNASGAEADGEETQPAQQAGINGGSHAPIRRYRNSYKEVCIWTAQKDVRSPMLHKG